MQTPSSNNPQFWRVNCGIWWDEVVSMEVIYKVFFFLHSCFHDYKQVTDVSEVIKSSLSIQSFVEKFYQQFTHSIRWKHTNFKFGNILVKHVTKIKSLTTAINVINGHQRNNLSYKSVLTELAGYIRQLGLFRLYQKLLILTHISWKYSKM